MKENSKTLLKALDLTAGGLLAIGGLNWGLIAFFDLDLVASVFGGMSAWTRTIYALVGFAALYDIIFYKIIQKRWSCEGFLHRIEGASV